MSTRNCKCHVTYGELIGLLFPMTCSARQVMPADDNTAWECSGPGCSVGGACNINIQSLEDGCFLLYCCRFDLGSPLQCLVWEWWVEMMLLRLLKILFTLCAFKWIHNTLPHYTHKPTHPIFYQWYFEYILYTLQHICVKWLVSVCHNKIIQTHSSHPTIIHVLSCSIYLSSSWEDISVSEVIDAGIA